MEKANSLIETDEENPEQLTGSGALSGTVPSGTQASATRGSESRGSASGTHPRPVKPVESGVFSGLSNQVTGDQLVDSLQSALSAASRGEAGLGSLHRSVRDASRALTSLRHAHESLGDELRVMYRGLNEVMSDKAAVERYAALLTQERDAALDSAEEARREAKREREFLLREQDRFIQLLLEEHEAELQQLRRMLSGRSSAPPAVIVEPTTGFRIGVEVKPGERPSRPSDLGFEIVEAGGRLTPVDSSYLRAVEERPRAIVPLPPRTREEDEPTLRPSARGPSAGGPSAGGPSAGGPSAGEPSAGGPSGAPLARLQLASSAPGANDDVVEEDGEEPGTERGIGERNAILDRSLTERSLIETLRSEVRSEVPAPDGEGRARTYPPPPAVLDLDSLAAEVEGNSERPPPIRRIGSLEPKLHLKPARLPTHLLDTLVSRTGDEEPEDQS